MIKSLKVRVIVSMCLVFGFLLAVPGTVDAQGTRLNYNSIKKLLNRVSLKSLPIWHLQLEITVANKENAGTDDDVYFKLRNGARYYLNSARDDFERGKKYTFPLLYRGVSKIGDIKYLTIGKGGNDGLCIKKVDLYINKATNSPIFSKTYSGGKWLDNDRDNKPSITFPLNNHSWNLRLTNLRSMNMIILPTIISQSNLEDIIETQIGDRLAEKRFRDNHIKWYKQGDEAVTVKRVDHNTIKVDLDLGWKWNRMALEVDVDFKIDINIRNGDIKIIARDFSITPGSTLLKMVPGISYLIKYLERRVSSEVDVIYEANNLRYIPKIEVKGDGDIEINWWVPVS